MVVRLGTSMWREEVPHEDTDRAHERVPEPTTRVDLDHDCRGVEPEELLVDTEHKLVVPRRVVVAIGVHPASQLAVWVDPRGCIGLHFPRHRLQILSRYDVYFQKLERL